MFNPITLDCGHNFCELCLLKNFKTKKTLDCCLCRYQSFNNPLNIHTNILLSDIFFSAINFLKKFTNNHDLIFKIENVIKRKYTCDELIFISEIKKDFNIEIN